GTNWSIRVPPGRRSYAPPSSAAVASHAALLEHPDWQSARRPRHQRGRHLRHERVASASSSWKKWTKSIARSFVLPRVRAPETNALAHRKWYHKTNLAVAGAILAVAQWAHPLAAATVDDQIAKRFESMSLPTPTPTSIIVCHGFGCRYR